MTSAALLSAVEGLTVAERLPVSSATAGGAGALTDWEVARGDEAQPRLIRVRVSALSTKLLWLEALQSGIRALLELGPDWDTYGAPPISQEAIKASVKTVFSIAGAETAPPMIVPTSAGGVQIEWHSDLIDVEVAIDPDGEASVFMEHRPDGRTWEGSLEEHVDFVREFLKPMRAAVRS